MENQEFASNSKFKIGAPFINENGDIKQSIYYQDNGTDVFIKSNSDSDFILIINNQNIAYKDLSLKIKGEANYGSAVIIFTPINNKDNLEAIPDWKSRYDDNIIIINPRGAITGFDKKVFTCCAVVSEEDQIEFWGFLKKQEVT